MHRSTPQESWEEDVLSGFIGADEKLETLQAIAKHARLSTEGDVLDILARIQDHVRNAGGGKLSAPSASTKKRGGSNNASDTDDLTEYEDELAPPPHPKKRRRSKQTAPGTKTTGGSKGSKKTAHANLRTASSRAKAKAANKESAKVTPKPAAKASTKKPTKVTPKPTTNGRIRISSQDAAKALERYGDSYTTLKKYYHAAGKGELGPGHGHGNEAIRKFLWLAGYHPPKKSTSS